MLQPRKLQSDSILAPLSGNEGEIFPRKERQGFKIWFLRVNKESGIELVVLFYPGDCIVKISYKKVTPLEILAPKKIHTRKNPDPNLTEVAFDPEKIIRKSQKRSSEIHIVSLERTFSLPKSEVESLEDVPFVVKFENFLVRTK